MEKVLKYFVQFYEYIYIYICKLDISTGTVSLQRIYLLKSLKSCLVLPKKRRKKKNKSKCIVYLLQQLQKRSLAETESLLHGGLPPDHFYRLVSNVLSLSY